MKSKSLIFKGILLSCLVGFAGTSAHARGVIDSSVIQKITTSGSSAYLINTGTDSRAVSGESIPACATNLKSMSLSSDDKANLALLLTASASGSTIRLVGKGECNEVGSIESIGFITVTN